MTDQSMDATKVQFGNHEFYWSYLKGNGGAEMTQRQARSPEYTAWPVGSSVGWIASSPDASVGLNLFQAARLVSSYRQMVWSQNLFLQLGLSESLFYSFIAYSGKEGPSESTQF